MYFTELSYWICVALNRFNTTLFSIIFAWNKFICLEIFRYQGQSSTKPIQSVNTKSSNVTMWLNKKKVETIFIQSNKSLANILAALVFFNFQGNRNRVYLSTYNKYRSVTYRNLLCSIALYLSRRIKILIKLRNWFLIITINKTQLRNLILQRSIVYD